MAVGSRGDGGELWFVSLTDGNRGNVASLPRMTEVPAIAEALVFARARAMTVRSLHVPRCLLGADHGHAYDPGADRVKVVTPEATFELRDSRLAGRIHVPACEGCPFEQVCWACARLPEVYGDAEIATARGQAATLRPRRLRPRLRSKTPATAARCSQKLPLRGDKGG